MTMFSTQAHQRLSVHKFSLFSTAGDE